MIDNLRRIAKAADADDWRGAVQAAKAQVEPVSLSLLLDHAELALRLAWVSAMGPCTLTKEFSRIFTADLGADCLPADVPAMFSGRVFALFLGAFRSAIRTQKPRSAQRALHCLVFLPCASNERALQLRAAVEELVDLVDAAQMRSAAEIPDPSYAPEPGAFGMAIVTYALLAQADFYPDLSGHFLRAYLRIAEFASLRVWRTDLALITWPDLMQIRADRQELRALSTTGRDWLYQITGPESGDDDTEETVDDEP